MKNLQLHIRAILEVLEEAVDKGELLAQKASEIRVGDIFPGSRLHQSVTGKQYIDAYIAKGFTKIKYITYRGKKNFYLCNPTNNHQIPVSGVLRKYAQWVLKNPIQEAMMVGEDGLEDNTKELWAVNGMLRLKFKPESQPFNNATQWRLVLPYFKHISLLGALGITQDSTWQEIRQALLAKRKQLTKAN